MARQKSFSGRYDLLQPGVLYGLFILLFVGYLLFWPVLADNLGSKYANPTYMEAVTMQAIYWFVGALVCISLITTIFNWQWFKEYWYVNTMVFIAGAFFLLNYKVFLT